MRTRHLTTHLYMHQHTHSSRSNPGGPNQIRLQNPPGMRALFARRPTSSHGLPRRFRRSLGPGHLSTEEGITVPSKRRADDARSGGLVLDVFEGWRDARDGGHGGDCEGTLRFGYSDINCSKLSPPPVILQIWKLSSGKCLRKLDPAHAKGITSLAFSRDSLQLATASFDGTARLHGIKAGRVLKVGKIDAVVLYGNITAVSPLSLLLFRILVVQDGG